MRFRFALTLMVAGMLFAAGIASAQTTTDDTSDYTTTTPTVTQTQPTEDKTTESAPASDTAGQEETSVAPSVAAQPAGSAPSTLAFTGGEPLLLIALGLALAGGTATLLVRDRRRSQN